MELGKSFKLCGKCGGKASFSISENRIGSGVEWYTATVKCSECGITAESKTACCKQASDKIKKEMKTKVLEKALAFWNDEKNWIEVK